MKIKILTTIILSCTYLQANDILNYTQGLEYYKTQQYQKAYPIILEEAKRGNKEAQYLLASFYENGYGIEKDLEQCQVQSKNAPECSAKVHHLVTPIC
jgi:hypothetical protein